MLRFAVQLLDTQPLKCMRNIGRRVEILDIVSDTVPSFAGKRSAPSSRKLAVALLSVFWLALAVVPLHGREHKKEQYGQTFSTEIDAPESEVLQAVQTVADNGIIRGTFEYNKDKYVERANLVSSSSLFPEWKDAGHGVLQSTHQGFGPGEF